ncbi:AAA family ATPase [Acidithrix sp. C25]|uniref:AAA family ATPase n=1 Tax=Acidithrix sp. C25 TaxID=1671482 RepID=UPI00191BBAA8|nr:AAA family ATPase [Acidithrix sp. C25]CAG4930191.1 unnamed protein product [Acidithrix sp. C25]
MSKIFPFSAVVGNEDLKLALIIAAIDPAIGGVLVEGDKGTAKSTLARSLSELIDLNSPFVELPLGATEDRLKGSIDLARLLGDKEVVISQGLIGKANRGILYVDEVNLLGDHLVDLVLDAAATGINRVERDNVSVVEESRFVLIGSMNREEGWLRPQLLDRFGLYVRAQPLVDPSERIDAVRRRLDFDRDPERFCLAYLESQLELREAIQRAKFSAQKGDLGLAASFDEGSWEEFGKIISHFGAPSLRGDLVLIRSSAAYAAWCNEEVVKPYHLKRVAPMVFGHRSDATLATENDRQEGDGNRSSSKGRSNSQAEGAKSMDERNSREDPKPKIKGETQDRVSQGSSKAPGQDLNADMPTKTDENDSMDDTPSPMSEVGSSYNALGEARAKNLAKTETETEGGPSRNDPSAFGDNRGRGSYNVADFDLSKASARPLLFDKSRPFGARNSDFVDPSRRPNPLAPSQSRGVAVASVALSTYDSNKIAYTASVVANIVRISMSNSEQSDLSSDDLRSTLFLENQARLVIVVLDTSSSMGLDRRVTLAREILSGVLEKSYQRRDKVALVAFARESASTILKATRSIELVERRLGQLRSGGTSPLHLGIQEGIKLCKSTSNGGLNPLLIVLSDHRPTSVQGDARVLAMAAAESIAFEKIEAVFVDLEMDHPKIGLCRELARLAKASYIDFTGQ